MYEDFVPERLAKLRTPQPLSEALHTYFSYPHLHVNTFKYLLYQLYSIKYPASFPIKKLLIFHTFYF